MKQLTKLDPNEVSLVPVGANQKKFLVLKEGSDPVLDRIRKSSPKVLEKILSVVVKAFGKKDENDEEDTINDKLEGLSPAAQTAARAIARIAAPHADELTGDHVDAVLGEVGIGEGNKNESEGGSKVKVKPEHMESAKSAAKKAYKEHMSKLGYQKYPEGELTMKEDDDEDDEDEKAKKAKAEKMKKEEEEEAEKAKKAKEAKVGKESILKEDGTINLEAVSTEQRPLFEAVNKMVTESASRAKAAEAKAADTEKVFKEHRESVRKAEIVRKSGEFKNLSQADSQFQLEMAEKAGPEAYEKVVKILEASNAQIGAGKLFTEVGNAGQSEGSLTVQAQIEKAVEGLVAKSADKITKEQAYADFMSTNEGQALYAKHQASRPNGI